MSTDLSKSFLASLKKLLLETGILKIFFKELQELHGVEEKNNHSHKDNFISLLSAIPPLPKIIV